MRPFDMSLVEGYGKVMNESTIKNRIEELYMESKDMKGKSMTGKSMTGKSTCILYC